MNRCGVGSGAEAGSELVFDSKLEFAPDTGYTSGFFALGQFDIRVEQVFQPGLEFPFSKPLAQALRSSTDMPIGVSVMPVTTEALVDHPGQERVRFIITNIGVIRALEI